LTILDHFDGKLYVPLNYFFKLSHGKLLNHKSEGWLCIEMLLWRSTEGRILNTFSLSLILFGQKQCELQKTALCNIQMSGGSEFLGCYLIRNSQDKTIFMRTLQDVHRWKHDGISCPSACLFPWLVFGGTRKVSMKFDIRGLLWNCLVNFILVHTVLVWRLLYVKVKLKFVDYFETFHRTKILYDTLYIYIYYHDARFIWYIFQYGTFLNEIQDNIIFDSAVCM
jgi:hypothetical protein